MQISDSVIANESDHKQAFNWWVKHVLKKKDRIIGNIRKLQGRYLKKSHKFGIKLPKTVDCSEY